MSEKYEHEGKHFTKQIAAELIFEINVGKPPIDETTLQEKVYQIHEAGGGLPPAVRRLRDTEKRIRSTINHYVRRALSELDSKGCATQKLKSVWQIHEMDIHRDEQTYPKRLGKGSQEVYLYYFRAYKERSIVKKINLREVFWECKIGETHDQDTETRVRQQTRTSPEKATIALIMETENSKRLETMIHNILKFWDKQVTDSNGDEWFLTSPEEVERIYDFLQ